MIHLVVNDSIAAGDESLLCILGGHPHDIKSDWGPCPQSIRGQSVYFIITSTPFSLPPSPMGNRSSETWPFKCVVMDKVTAQLYVCALSVCMCVFLPADVYTTKTKGVKEQFSHLLSLRSHPSELDLTLEDGCGPVVQAPTLDGSKALLREPELVELIRHTVRLTVVGLGGPCSSVL